MTEQTIDDARATLGALMEVAHLDGDLAKITRLDPPGESERRETLVKEIIRLLRGYAKIDGPQDEITAKITAHIAQDHDFNSMILALDDIRSLSVIVRFVVEHAG